MAKAVMNEAARQKRNEYYRKWRAANKDRVKAINARYWTKKAMEAAAEDPAPAPDQTEGRQ